MADRVDRRAAAGALGRRISFLSVLGALALLAALLGCALSTAALFALPALPPAGTPEPPGARLDAFLRAAAGDALAAPPYVRKIYRLAEDATTAPRPDESAFGVTEDPAVIDALFAAAGELMEGQERVWDSNAAFAEGSVFHYYYDETLLAVTWQERRVPATLTFCEVKLAHGSQLRRKLAEDTYGSRLLRPPTALARECQAVVAMNADFYALRDYGVNVYQGKLLRWNGGAADSCFFDRGGHMLFARAGELTEQAQAQAFIDEHDIVTGLSFGPIMVENGVNVTPAYYPIGEYLDPLARCCLGQTDELHYLLCAADYYFTVSAMAELMISKGVEQAYNMDGGQSASLIIHGEQINPNIFQVEREQSDILYFATAIPERQ